MEERQRWEILERERDPLWHEFGQRIERITKRGRSFLVVVVVVVFRW